MTLRKDQYQYQEGTEHTFPHGVWNKPKTDMPKLVGSIAALVALSAGILAGVDPVACVLRALAAFLIGCFGTTLWYVMFMGVLPSSAKAKGKAQ